MFTAPRYRHLLRDPLPSTRARSSLRAREPRRVERASLRLKATRASFSPRATSDSSGAANVPTPFFPHPGKILSLDRSPLRGHDEVSSTTSGFLATYAALFVAPHAVLCAVPAFSSSRPTRPSHDARSLLLLCRRSQLVAVHRVLHRDTPDLVRDRRRFLRSERGRCRVKHRFSSRQARTSLRVKRGFLFGSVRSSHLPPKVMQPPRDPFGGAVGYRNAPWPRPRELWGRNLYDDALVFDRAPFVSSDGLRDEELIRHYSAASEELPGGLSLAAVRSRDFTHRLVVEPALLRPELRRTTAENRVAFVELIRQRMRRTPCSRLLPCAWDFVTWAYHTEDDRVYVANLKRILDNPLLREEAPSKALVAWGCTI